jgi:predicted alpha/beta-hydrolase family hydrolase
MLAHIAGAPVEETALSLAPVALAAAGLATARLRHLATRRPSWQRRARRHGYTARQS